MKLDNLLNADVAVLRDQIDTACYEFSEANRRFQMAEKEYVDSKFDLQKKTETKVSQISTNNSKTPLGQSDRASYESYPSERGAKAEKARGADVQAQHGS